MRIADGDKLTVEGLSLDVLYTPGHTDDSYSFHFGDRVFTGDTLLIRGTGRTDFQNGDSRAQYESLQRLLRLPEETLVFPAHDYKGDTVCTIGEEKRFNPRLKVRDADEYAALMASLNLPNPKMMDVAVPANIHQGLHQQDVARKGWAFSAAEAKGLVGRPDVALIDLREKSERERTGAIPGSLHAPYAELMDNIGEGGLIHELAQSGKTIVFYCAFGERSAMAVQAAQDQGLDRGPAHRGRHVRLDEGRRRGALTVPRRSSVAFAQRLREKREACAPLREASMPKVKVNDITINYEQQGSGEPLVLIPYLAADNACYAFQVADYAKHFTCISLDPRGAGETDKPEGTYSTELFADDVAGFMQAIGVEKAHVSGVSLGAAVGQWLASKYPQQVKTLSLHSAGRRPTHS